MGITQERRQEELLIPKYVPLTLLQKKKIAQLV
jgi:hypothetical protein